MTDMTRAEAYEYHATARIFMEYGMDADGVEPPAFETADEMSQRLFNEPAGKYVPEVQIHVPLTGDQMGELALLSRLTETSFNDLIRQAVDNLLFDARYDGAFDGQE